MAKNDYFERKLREYRDPSTPEFRKGTALGEMKQMVRQTEQYNKKNNPGKYHADMAKKAKRIADYHANKAR